MEQWHTIPIDAQVSRQAISDALPSFQSQQVLLEASGYRVVALPQELGEEDVNCLQWTLGTDQYSSLEEVFASSICIEPSERRRGDYVIYSRDERFGLLSFTHIAFVTEGRRLLSKLGPGGPLVEHADPYLVPIEYGTSYMVIRRSSN